MEGNCHRNQERFPFRFESRHHIWVWHTSARCWATGTIGIESTGTAIIASCTGAPQSTSLSSPFCTPSSQAGAAQALLTQTPLAQSPGALQAKPPAQAAQSPPQSRAVSVPFCTPSSQAGAAQTLLTQTPLAQSPGALQAKPSLHRQRSPHHSRGRSRCRSARRHHRRARHWALLTQTPLAQSPGALQAKPSAQAAQSPPQSRAVSVPVLHAVITGGRGTGVIDADAAGAIAGGITGQAVGTGSAVPTSQERSRCRFARRHHKRARHRRY